MYDVHIVHGFKHVNVPFFLMRIRYMLKSIASHEFMRYTYVCVCLCLCVGWITTSNAKRPHANKLGATRMRSSNRPTFRLMVFHCLCNAHSFANVALRATVCFSCRLTKLHALAYLDRMWFGCVCGALNCFRKWDRAKEWKIKYGHTVLQPTLQTNIFHSVWTWCD